MDEARSEYLPPDVDCYTLPNGDCVSAACRLHGPPHDYIWNGQRITHYLNHAATWQSAPATEAHHRPLMAAQSGRSGGSDV